MVRNSMSSLVVQQPPDSAVQLALVNLLVFVHTLYMCMCASRC